MTNGLKLRNYKITKLQNPERGYILITLMLFVSLLAIAALTVLPAVKQQIQRDREEELIHRGTAYMRAIQHFYKKFGRYPTKVEELENTNNIRFLRKRYKDPMNRDPESHKEKDFKLLHLQDINLYTGGVNSGVGLAGAQAQPFGQNPLQSQLGSPNQNNGLPASHQLGQNNAAPGNDNNSDGGDNGNNASTDQNQDNSTNSNNPGAPGPTSPQANSIGGNQQVFGGGPVLGVASLSKEKSIREFGDKYKHYKDWLFIYDPTADMGGLLKGPVVPGKGGKGGGMGISAGTLATQSQGGATTAQPQTQPQQQGPQTPQMPPEQEQ